MKEERLIADAPGALSLAPKSVRDKVAALQEENAGGRGKGKVCAGFHLGNTACI